MDDALATQIKELKASGFSKRAIERKLNIGSHRINCVLDPANIKRWQEARKIAGRHQKRSRVNSAGRVISLTSDSSDPEYDPYRDGFVYHTSLTSELFGDPLPGRSALDERNQKHI